jgi:hypothetical protein
MVVYVLLFNARTENEGIHSLKVEEQDVVLMFEAEDDATRFALMLEAQDFPEATVEAIEQEDIEEFCQQAGYQSKMVPVGTLAMPPEQAVDQLDWDPSQPADSRERAGSSQDDTLESLSDEELDRWRRQLERLL